MKKDSSTQTTWVSDIQATYKNSLCAIMEKKYTLRKKTFACIFSLSTFLRIFSNAVFQKKNQLNLEGFWHSSEEKFLHKSTQCTHFLYVTKPNTSWKNLQNQNKYFCFNSCPGKRSLKKSYETKQQNKSLTTINL